MTTVPSVTPSLGEPPRYSLTLFVSGASGLSARAIIDTRAMCESALANSYELAVIDVHINPAIAVARGIIATPTLVRSRPLPERKHVGSVSPTGGVLAALGLTHGDTDR